VLAVDEQILKQQAPKGPEGREEDGYVHEVLEPGRRMGWSEEAAHEDGDDESELHCVETAET
jgi:hypothetical protein